MRKQAALALANVGKLGMSVIGGCAVLHQLTSAQGHWRSFDTPALRLLFTTKPTCELHLSPPFRMTAADFRYWDTADLGIFPAAVPPCARSEHSAWRSRLVQAARAAQNRCAKGGRSPSEYR
jgi:hypothetical protein